MLRRILVPLDGSTFAETALPAALALNRRSGAVLELMTVHEPIPSFAYDEWETSAREWSQNYLDDVRGRTGGHTADGVETTVRSGRVAEALRQRALDTGADLVVMATHGRGALTRAWLGSVADALVRHSPCPVLLIRPQENEPVDLTVDWTPHAVLVPLDGSELGESILADVVPLADLFDAGLVLLRIVAYPMEIASPYLPHTVQMNQRVVEDAKASAVAHLDGVAAGLREKGLDVETTALVDTQAGHGILQAVERADADMIAMATHARTGMSRAFLGSTADKVLRGAHLPVFLYRPGRH